MCRWETKGKSTQIDSEYVTNVGKEEGGATDSPVEVRGPGRHLLQYGVDYSFDEE